MTVPGLCQQPLVTKDLVILLLLWGSTGCQQTFQFSQLTALPPAIVAKGAQFSTAPHVVAHSYARHDMEGLHCCRARSCHACLTTWGSGEPAPMVSLMSAAVSVFFFLQVVCPQVLFRFILHPTTKQSLAGGTSERALSDQSVQTFPTLGD